MRVTIVTDAWRPQVNGVVRTYEQTSAQLVADGHHVQIIGPEKFRTLPCPTYPEIRLAWRPGALMRNKLDEFGPQAIHIATEGPLGHAASKVCRTRRWPFTTSFHTQFPEYIRARIPVPISCSYAYLRRFHSRATRTMVATVSLRTSLEQRRFENLVIWSRGVDTTIFRPGRKDLLEGPRPIAMYMGRVAVEKNIEAFLALPFAGTKYVVGAGPDLERLRRRYPYARFTGPKFGTELAAYLSAADVFVFPSLTDTYGLAMLEAMACGVPVAAFPVTGPVDVVKQGVTGVLDDDLGAAIQGALSLEPSACVAFAASRSWERCTQTFLSLMATFEP